MGMFVVAPCASSFHNSNNQEPIMADHHNIINNPSSTSLNVGVGVGLGVFPLLAASPQPLDDASAASRAAAAAGYQFWQSDDHHENIIKKPTILDNSNNNISMNLMQNYSSSATTTCQDCGNQAKKDCRHRRCRSCCKSRNFDCPTHVKSTWVPATRRRERQQLMANANAGSLGTSSSVIKKARVVISSQNTATSHTSTSNNNTPPRSFDTSSSHQDASFKEGLPEQVRAPAVFKCVRMTALEDEEDEYAYQATVKINGHVFKGLLYNQGVVQNKDSYPNISELHLGGATSGGGGGSSSGGRNGGSSVAPIINPTNVYGGSGGMLGGGSSYGNPIN